ncbi:hypothetical protein [Scleromatobacter humisilvae]|uniref:Uncharacterized protein n=1 Tax=Scleromatobacter humisilvae TaxID=2897159 RepID=A0A9X1YNF0_9BURK|nr:hypothetical protein [Scleromatobacter humisilvae]MCK9687943.1 hypothetical protein [Scleromatobacter humisilvae]
MERDQPRATAQPAPRQYSSFLPQLLTGLTLVVWLGLQAFQQVGERQQLASLDAAIAPQEQGAQKVRNSLEAIATATAKLASEGNANAQIVVDQLKKRGVTINTPAQ